MLRALEHTGHAFSNACSGGELFSIGLGCSVSTTFVTVETIGGTSMRASPHLGHVFMAGDSKELHLIHRVQPLASGVPLVLVVAEIVSEEDSIFVA